MQYSIFENVCKQTGITLEKEIPVNDLIYEFSRKHKVDYVLSKNGKCAIIEIEGGTSTEGFWNDCLKYNTLSTQYALFRFPAIMIKDTPIRVVEFINKFLTDTLTGDYLTKFYKENRK